MQDNVQQFRQTVNETLHRWNAPKKLMALPLRNKEKKRKHRWIKADNVEKHWRGTGKGYPCAIGKMRKEIEAIRDCVGRQVWGTKFEVKRTKQNGYKYAIYFLTCQRINHTSIHGVWNSPVTERVMVNAPA